MRPLARLAVAALALVAAGCGYVTAQPTPTFQDASRTALTRARSWSADARLVGFSGAGVGRDGKTRLPSGTWYLDYVAAAKPGLLYRVNVSTDTATALEQPLDTAAMPDAAAFADALAAWSAGPSGGVDSPRWFSDGAWPDSSVQLARNQCPRKSATDPLHACAPSAEDGALLLYSYVTPSLAWSATAVELHPTYRALPVTRP